MMLAVAAITPLFLVVTLCERADRARDYHRQALYHAMMERSSLTAVIQGPSEVGPHELARLNRIRSAHHAALRQKYEQATARPWEHLPADPPDPVTLFGPGRYVELDFAP
jgi:hypothetical protein